MKTSKNLGTYYLPFTLKQEILLAYSKPVKEHRRSDPDTAVGKSLRFFRRF